MSDSWLGHSRAALLSIQVVSEYWHKTVAVNVRIAPDIQATHRDSQGFVPHPLIGQDVEHTQFLCP